MSNDLSIASALAEIIAGLNPAIVPATTIAAPGVAAGALTVPLADASAFIAGSRLAVWDGATERNWAVKSVDYPTNVVTLSTDGLSALGITGLLAGHAAGAAVTANLMDFEPVRIGQMLATGKPVAFAYATQEGSRIIGQHRSGGIIQFNIEVRRTIVKPEESVIDDNDWVEAQEAVTRQNLQQIQDAIQGNRNLVTSTGPHALTLGDGTGGPEFRKAWGRLVVSADNEQFAGVLQLTAKAVPHSF